MTETTEQQYLEMAAHCKKVVEEKDCQIKHLKSLMEDAEEDLRKLEYELFGMNFLLNYKISQRERHQDTVFYDTLQNSFKKIQNYVDSSRSILGTDMDDEDIIMILENLDN